MKSELVLCLLGCSGVALGMIPIGQFAQSEKASIEFGEQFDVLGPFRIGTRGALLSVQRSISVKCQPCTLDLPVDSSV